MEIDLLSIVQPVIPGRWRWTEAFLAASSKLLAQEKH